MNRNMTLKIGLIVVVGIALGAWFIKQNGQEVETRQTAIHIATEHLKTLPRYQTWKAKGLQYEVTQVLPDTPTQAMTTVTFDLSQVTDQEIRIVIDMRTQQVAQTHLHVE